MASNKPRARLAGLEAELAVVEADLIAAMSIQPELAHGAALGSDTEATRFQSNRDAIAALQTKKEILGDAITHEQRQIAAKARAKLEAERVAIRERALEKARVLFHVEIPKQAELLDAAVAQFHRNIKLLDEINACLPLRQPVDTGWLLHAQELREAVNREIARIDGTHGSGMFPRAPGLGLIAFSPTQIPALVDVARENFEGLKRELTERAVFPEIHVKDTAA